MESYGNYNQLGAGISFIYIAFVCAMAIVVLMAQWKIFTKAGKPGWAAIVPIYNTYCFYDIAWGKGWMFLLTLIPIVNVVAMIIMNLKLAKAFGKSVAFAIGMLLLTPVFYVMLGFGSAEYIGPQE